MLSSEQRFLPRSLSLNSAESGIQRDSTMAVTLKTNFRLGHMTHKGLAYGLLKSFKLKLSILKHRKFLSVRN